jgi:putative ABC transport system permease protein
VQRQREIGIRMALGARAREVVGLFYKSGMRLGILGLALGLPLSLIAVRLFNAELEQLDPQGEPSLLLLGLVIGVVVLGVASAATLLPARRAATVDPISVLRSE